MAAVDVSTFRQMDPDQEQVQANGHYGHSQHDQHDQPAKRQKRATAMVRKCVDPAASIVRHIWNRKFQRSWRDRDAMNPHSSYARFLLPPHITTDNPAMSYCTHLCRTSINKQRCPVNSLVWTPEGRRLITGNSSGEFTLWNGHAFNFETILQAHDHSVRAMTWSHNENWLVTADHGGIIKYWQSSMTNVQLLQGHREAVRSLSFSPTDYKFVSCSDDATVKIWDFERGTEERTLTGHGWDVKCVAYHPHKSLLASGSKDNLVKLWDPKSGNSLATLHGHKNTVLKVAWSKNGQWLLTASRDQLIKLYDLRTLKNTQTFRGHNKEVTSIAWHPIHESVFLSGAFDGTLLYWILGEDEPQAKIYYGHDNAVWDIAWHPVGHVVATGSNDHTTKFWARPRPGDTLEDRYNNPEALEEYEAWSQGIPRQSQTFEAAEAEQGVKAMFIPGVGESGAGGFDFDSSRSASIAGSVGGSEWLNDGGRLSNLSANFARGGRRPPPPGYTCNKCGEKGHWIHECPTSVAKSDAGHRSRKTPPEGYVCKRCSIPGHFIQDCPEAKKPPPNYTCHRCGQKGHWKSDCPADSNREEGRSSRSANAAAGREADTQGPGRNGRSNPPPGSSAVQVISMVGLDSKLPNQDNQSMWAGGANDSRAGTSHGVQQQWGGSQQYGHHVETQNFQTSHQQPQYVPGHSQQSAIQPPEQHLKEYGQQNRPNSVPNFLQRHDQAVGQSRLGGAPISMFHESNREFSAVNDLQQQLGKQENVQYRGERGHHQNFVGQFGSMPLTADSIQGHSSVLNQMSAGLQGSEMFQPHREAGQNPQLQSQHHTQMPLFNIGAQGNFGDQMPPHLVAPNDQMRAGGRGGQRYRRGKEGRSAGRGRGR